MDIRSNLSNEAQNMNDLNSYIQNNPFECGLCSIAAFLHVEGKPYQLEPLRQKVNVASTGLHMAEIISILDSYGYSSDGVEFEANDIFTRELSTPFIAHYKANHWVLVLDISTKNITVFNPINGINIISHMEFSGLFSGKAIQSHKKIILNNRDSRVTVIKTIFTSIPNLKKFIINIVFISILIELFIILFPYYTQIAIDHVITTSDQELLNIIAIAAVSLVSFQGIFAYLKTKTITHLSVNLRLQLLDNIKRHFYNLPMMYYAQNNLGDLKSRIDSAEFVSKTIADLVSEIFVDLLICISSSIIMFFYNQSLAKISFLLGLTIVFLKIKTYNKVLILNSRKLTSEISKDVCLIENIRAIHVSKMNSGVKIRSEKWRNILIDTINIDEDILLINGLNKSLQTVAGGISYILIIYIAIGQIEKQEITIGLLFAYIVYHQNFVSRIGGLTDRAYMSITLKDHFSRIFGIVAQKIEGNEFQVSKIPFVKSLDYQHVILTKNISFKYPNSTKTAISDVEIRVGRNDFFVLSGPSGSGKTTVLCILAGIYMPTTGAVFAFNNLVTAINSVSYRHNVSFVFQNEEFFSGTIIENISMFSNNVDFQRIKFVAKIACIHDEIMDLSNGYNTILGENGIGLSGGQKQRIAIARALYKDPKLLFLDEATSQLDDKLERTVILNLQSTGIPIIMATHSLFIKQQASDFIEL